VSLDAPDTREAAVTDPRGFLAAFPPPVMVVPGHVVSLGDRRLPLGDDVTSWPLSEL